MCGRFALRFNRGHIRALRGNDAPPVDEWEGEDDFVPRYNIAPRTHAPVVRRRDPGPSGSGASSSTCAGSAEAQAGGASSTSNSTTTSNTAPLIMQTMKWGLIPHWAKVEDSTLNTINARAENLAEGGGMWGSIKGKKRCAVPAQGYYEWLTKGKDKLPHFIKRKDNDVLLMAGLYDSAVIDGRTIWSFTIVTTDAAPSFSWLHDRQPVFLTSRAALDTWLDTSSQTWTPELSKFVLQPYHDDANVPLECYQVPKEVGKIGTESPTFVEPVANRKDGIQAMFAKQKQSQQHSNPPPQSKQEFKSEPSQSQATERRESSEGKSSQAQPSSPSKGKVKRGRSSSPVIDLSKDDEAEDEAPKAKKAKLEDTESEAHSSSPKRSQPKVRFVCCGLRKSIEPSGSRQQSRSQSQRPHHPRRNHRRPRYVLRQSCTTVLE
ncbi:hypothetical protein DFP72DRAFT_909583 [Ephemerocybe angulata]|uniref:DUF159-domain-containing protein n=1 Tax=Ephemerocybe angulata TaxID=980116 RepID=A0A8H6HRA2_9AGAR|nr:hypothetical protein DFP72DRAFT_909583 [Tulosesus angulatus]